MEALKLFSKHAPNKTFVAIVFGIINGAFLALLVPLVMLSIARGSSNLEYEGRITEYFGIEILDSKLAFFYFGICFSILLLRSTSEVLLTRIALEVRLSLRRELYSKIQKSSISALERIGTSKLVEALSTDISTIVTGAAIFPKLLTQSFTILGMLIFLAYLNLDVFIWVLKIIVIGVVLYQLPIIIGSRYFSRARHYKDALHESIRGLIAGSKELKVNESKKHFYNSEVIGQFENKVMTPEKKGMTIYTLGISFSELLSFITIGCLGFIFVNYSFISTAEVVSVVMILLYITGPISSLLNFLPELEKSKISLRKLNELYLALPNEGVREEHSPIGSWKRLRLENVSYQYQNTDLGEEAFEVGPINLELERGEVTFIVGGNGSGKSTLAKIITQHYLPTKGHVYYDSVVLDESNITSFRQEVSCIYSDYYLFEQLLCKEANSVETKSKIDKFIKDFGLEGIVRFENGSFSTLRLSDGQRRRLALIISMFEEKSLLLFDEWAADQDPEFKHMFYSEILPMLKEQGKAVIVISHDDRYFDLASKILIMEDGKLVDKQTFESSITSLKVLNG